MHTVTFYSFKGGSGRSMALVNVAVELVKAGQKVLIVDFDLEAPGLDTFNLPRPIRPSKGIVDAVLEYIQTGKSPIIDEFIYKSAIQNVSGELWVMPAGRPDQEYDRKFKSINWQDLYDNKDGYLLFEDIKEQWAQVINPDYILIDSRTGHTDVSGICTRQLPDSVILFTFPTEQNRRGLENIVKQIRGEAQTIRQREIILKLVLSNLPETDDEEGYLARNIEKIKESCDLVPSAIIHHYSSLALLEQSVFTLDRPKTKLAQEYIALTKLVRQSNLEDREVALAFVEEAPIRARGRILLAGELETRLNKIKEYHRDDPEILTKLALLYRRFRRFDEALTLLEIAGDLKANGAEFYLNKAELHIITGEMDSAFENIKKLLNSDDATFLEVSAAAQIFQKRFENALPELIQSPAFQRLDVEGKVFVSQELFETRNALNVARKIFSDVNKKGTLIEKARFPLDESLALIGLGKFQEALDVITENGKFSFGELNLAGAFNYSMAQWGIDGTPSVDLLKRVVELEGKNPVVGGNGLQCISIALWVIGEIDIAKTRLQEAWQKVVTDPSPEFSAWSYLRLSRDAFIKDLSEMEKLFQGENIEPRFIRETRALNKVQNNA